MKQVLPGRAVDSESHSVFSSTLSHSRKCNKRINEKCLEAERAVLCLSFISPTRKRNIVDEIVCLTGPTQESEVIVFQTPSLASRF